MRSVYVANVALAALLLSTLAFFIGRETQADSTKQTDRNLRVAIVNVSAIMRDSQDVQLIQSILDKHREIQNLINRFLERDIERAQEDYDYLNRDSNEVGGVDWQEALRRLDDLKATQQSLPATTQFRQREDFTRYSSRFLEKMLEEIEHCAAGGYDLVYKVLDPTAEELQELEEMDVLNLNKARDILYHDTDAIGDLTERVVDRINYVAREDGLNGHLNRRIADLDDKITDLRQAFEAGADMPVLTWDEVDTTGRDD